MAIQRSKVARDGTHRPCSVQVVLCESGVLRTVSRWKRSSRIADGKLTSPSQVAGGDACSVEAVEYVLAHEWKYERIASA